MPTVSPLPEIIGYDVLGTLGYGARSTIYAVRDKDGNPFALKRVIRNSAADQRYLDQAILEHDIARRFTHPNLRRIYKVVKVRKFLRLSELFVVMEMVEGSTLEQYRFKSMQDLCRISLDLALGLHEMHEGGYVHCDIKPSNVIVTPEHVVKIIDFGQSCPIGTIKQRIQGTPDYIAPEQVRRRKITPATDVFNLGATLYWMLTKRHVPTLIPRDNQRVAVTPTKEEACVPPRELNPTVPPAMNSLVMNCVETDPAERPQTMLQLHERITWAMAQIERESAAQAPAEEPKHQEREPDTTDIKPDGKSDGKHEQELGEIESRRRSSEKRRRRPSRRSKDGPADRAGD